MKNKNTSAKPVSAKTAKTETAAPAKAKKLFSGRAALIHRLAAGKTGKALAAVLTEVRKSYGVSNALFSRIVARNSRRATVSAK